MIEISKIRIDGGTQPRAELNQETVADYAEPFAFNGPLTSVSLTLTP